MSYIVNFKAKGRTKPDALNPKGIKVVAEGSITVEGERPARNIDIPFSVVEQCKAAFVKECSIDHYDGDENGSTSYPTVWLGRKLKMKV